MMGFLIVGRADAQYNVEQSIKSYSFKGTHNSYDQDHDIIQQLDAYNVWCLELDMCGVSSDNELEIKHGCIIGSPNGLFTEFLQQIKQTTAWNNRITFLWLEVKETCDNLCQWRDNNDSERADLMADDLESVLGEDYIYKKSDWGADGKVWPSIQDLLERQKYFICIYDNNDHNPDHSLLFVSAHKPDKIHDYTAFLNVKDGNIGTFPGRSPMDNDQFLWRSYGLNDKSEWDAASDVGIHILSTDEYRSSWTFTEKTFPPVPMHVDVAFTAGQEFGTYAFPFGEAHFQSAVDETAEHAAFVIAPGSYDTSATINKALIPKIQQTGALGSSSLGSVIIGEE